MGKTVVSLLIGLSEAVVSALASGNDDHLVDFEARRHLYEGLFFVRLPERVIRRGRFTTNRVRVAT